MVQMNPRTDGQLLSAHLAGDAGAFAELVGRHEALVMGACRRLLGAGPEAEDAAQAAFLLLLRKAGGLAGSADLGGWLHRAAVLVSRQARRSRRRRELHEKEAAAMRQEGGGVPADAGDGAAVWRECAGRLDEAMLALPEVQRQALVLCYFEGLSQSQAAERLGCPETTLASRCARGLERLRERLGASERRLGAAALGALLLARGCVPAPAGFATSIVSAAKGAAAGAPATALVEGVMKTMFWTKVKIVAAALGVAAVLAIGTPLIIGAVSAEQGFAPKPPVAAPAPAPAADAGKDAPAVDGLKLSLLVAPDYLLCGDACRKKLNQANGMKQCPGCIMRCNAGHASCTSCSFLAGACEVCGAKLPGGIPALAELEAGKTARLLVVFENTSKEKMRVCQYLLGMRKLKLAVTGPDADSVKSAPTGMMFMLAAISENDFPEVAPGGKWVFTYLAIGGNPPHVGQGASNTYLLKAGDYKIVATYSNDEDSYFDNQKKQQVKPAEKVWKGEVKSGECSLKITGQPAAMPAGGFKRPLMAN
ncbi:MAG TPA: sigma-70 family RNA polymerase sigma factor [Planctomycetota bacterium]|nr:sigma-70 family RNA polymerase sigma factor [Planctomycetota bacterium]